MSFNIIQPSLIQQLKTILEQYPDDGQILKELIQNAEDAGARQVKFLHDKHSYGTEKLYSYGTEQLPRNELVKFQGPALYAYNDAQFTNDNWEGIRMLSNSKKVKDPMKVGRFGFGFKSVFHLTDLPSIVSGSQIGVIDPHKQCFGDQCTGYSWDMNKDREAMYKIPDQFAPYKEVFDCTEEVFSRGSYNGTLFRFPLRNKPSKLSQTLYSAEKVRTLFNGFMADAHLILLFLRHLECIELYVRETTDTQPRKTFEVRITDESLQLIRKRRKEFQSMIITKQLMSQPVHVTYPITIETVDFSKGTENGICRHSFLVTNYFCGGEVSPEFQTLASDESLSYLPLVGVAMNLSASSEEATPAVKGHVFCFLPLPIQKTSLTGLPVHVNGFFALSQDRRDIKFLNAEQEDQERTGHQLTDKSLLWNKCLLEEAIPKAYATMILEAIKEKSLKIQAEVVYRAWPDVERVKQNWERISEPLMQILLGKEIVYSKANRGEWLTVEKAYFNQLPENETKELLQRVLLAANVPVVSVPSHVIKGISSYCSFDEITAHLTRLVLKEFPSCYKKYNRREKLLLLHFCLQDHKFAELCDLELLPLSNGAFTTFLKRADRIYICSREHPKELLPGLQHRLLDKTVDQDIIRKLKEAAKQERTQLRLLSKDSVAVLLRQALPSDWDKGKTVSWYPSDGSPNHPPRDWINLVWSYLRDHFTTAGELQRLENLPLIPLSMSQKPVFLTRLCYPSTIVVKSLDGDVINDALTDVLTKLGLVVLRDCPTFISHHPAVLGTFVHRPSVQGILKAMVTSASKLAKGTTFAEIVRKNLSTKEKHILRCLLANFRPAQVGKEEHKFLCSLPVFVTLSMRFVSKNEGLSAAPVECLPIPPLRDLVDVSHEDSRSFADLLKVRILKPSELLCEVIFPDMQQGKYSEEEIDKLMPYVLKHFAYDIRNFPTFKQNVQDLQFVPKQRERVRVSDVFDPRDNTLKKIFALENVFPVGDVYNDPTVLDALEDLGMKNESSIDATDVLQSAKQVRMITELPTARAKSNSILQHLSIHPQKLKETINGQQLGSLLMKIRWVPRLLQKTSNFPPSLPWWESDKEEEEEEEEKEEEDDEEDEKEEVKSEEDDDGDKEEEDEEEERDGKCKEDEEKEDNYFFKPTELRSHRMVNLIGTVKPVVDVEPSEEVSTYFGWLKEPDVFDVVNHLQNVASYYTKEDKPYYMVMLNKIYSFLSRANYEALIQAFQRTETFDWVWNGDGFSSPKQVLPSKPPIDLTPYILSLPSEMMKHSHLFNRFGMRAKSDSALLLQVLGLIKEKYDKNSQFDAPEVKHDLQLSVDILNEVVQEELSPEFHGKILLPTHVEDNSYLRLEPVENCITRDVPDHSAWMPDVSDKKLVHEKIPRSTCKQLGVKTPKEGDLQRHDAGFPFGQKEELKNRLKHILKGYPGQKEILKELLQNADDARATKICFIKDPRYHPDKEVFKESWKPLQGPALCVYNNRPFTNSDIEGLCNLGKGSKGEDPNKTGQYGVGFNAVYHLTDVPSFRSTGEEIGDVLCVLDPHCRYVPGASNENPGRKFIDIENLKRKVPDVFRCYLEEHFTIKNATMFRFPLKSEKMAEESEISKTPITVEALDEMMKELKKELFEVLLFINNVREISICEIDKSGKLHNTYSVEVFMSQEDDWERQAFADYIKEYGRQVKQENFLPTSIKAKKCMYTMMLRDSFGKEQTWLIVQQIGFEKPPEKRIVEAFKNHQLGMLPRGGVAYLLKNNSVRSTMQGKSKAYCFLPLPFETNLPVHINGHFALDHEARRNLWRDEAGGYRSDWNNALLRDVITSCFLTLLDKVRGFIQLPVEQDGATRNSAFSRSAILAGLVSFEKLFPTYPFEDPYWKTLVDSVYQEMDKKEMCLIPVLKRFEGSLKGGAKNSKGRERVQVRWFPPTGTGKEATYFNNLEKKGCFASLPLRRYINEKERLKREEDRIKRKNKFEEILLETGFNLVALSISVFASFREAGVEVCCVSPSAVVGFYKSLSDVDPLCKIGKIPCPVGTTPFRDPTGVISVLKYCKDDDQFLENLSGLPLLVTQDNYLRTFSESSPRCLSQYIDILPRSPSLFVHKMVLQKVFNCDDCKNASVFRPLDVQTFSSQLHLTLSRCFFGEDHYRRWCPNDPASNLPNRRWIYRVWDFLQDFARETMQTSNVGDKNKTSFIRDLLLPLSVWSILPATKTIQLVEPQILCSVTTGRDKQIVEEHFLVPLNMAESVLDFTGCGASSNRLVEALRNLGLPELNSVVMSNSSVDEVSYVTRDSYEFARNLVATLKAPRSLVKALNQKLKTNPCSLDRKLKDEDAIVVLDYFSRNTEALTDMDRETLRKLPFFLMAGGGLGKTEDRNVFVLPGEIPKTGMDVVESKLGCLFIESRQTLSDLYEFLEFQYVLPAEVYQKFVLKCFPLLSLKGKLAHLRYLRGFIFSISSELDVNEELEKKRLLDHLRTVEFIPAIDGSSKTASNFYDPRNEVFRTMLSEDEDSFPPAPFNSDEWLTFLEKIDLTTVVSQDHFLTFAEQVALEAETERTENTYLKAEVLVHHLISRQDVVEEGLLRRVRDIPFVAANPVKESLQAISPPFRDKKDGEIPFIAFNNAVVTDYEDIVWTKAHLLPRWADPSCNRRKLNFTRGNTDQYLNAFLAQLHVQKKPTVGLVISHCQTVSMKRNIPFEQCTTVMKVMEHIYSFLQENPIKDPVARMQLQTTPCILVEGGKQFILPKQVVLELYQHLEIKPFLYSVPPAFGKFQPLFEFLGCSKTVTSRHYAMVLESLQKNCQNVRLDPNELYKCSKAVRGFFDGLQKDTGAVSTLSQLYLPAIIPGLGFSNTPLKINVINTTPVALHQSTKLVFDDAPTYGHRIRGLDLMFVLDLSLMQVSLKSTMMSYKDLMMKLPHSLQPKMLSSLVREKLSAPENTDIVLRGDVNALKQQLTSVQFGRGIARIIRDVNSQTTDFDERVIASIERGLRSIELFAIKGLKTSLFYNEDPIPRSERGVPYFKEKVQISGVETWKVYIDVATGMDDTISTLVTVIVEMYGEFLGMKTYIIPDMLRCPPAKISSLLDKRGVRKDDSYNAAQMEIYPEPGTLIPIEDHHLLNDAFEEFEAGEYVGFQVDDPSLDQVEGIATYIYAIVVEEVTNGDGILTKEYRINIGHDKEPVVVSAANLHKFHRLKEIFDDQEEFHGNREEVFREITGILKKAWKLKEDERVQIVKRLFMRWFPKENVANNELCRVAFQHIKNEVSRLGGSYDALFSSWEARARECASQRETYRERFSRECGSWQSSLGNRSRQVVPPSFCDKNPQPGEAKRWFRQAEVDLEAGANELESSRHSYEWVCFKCHQAAEKALKAVQYKVDANQKTNDHNLFHNCCGFNDCELTELATQLERLVVNSAHMRYPDTMSYPKIPNDVYTAEVAEEALEIATKILERVRETKLRISEESNSVGRPVQLSCRPERTPSLSEGF